MVEHATKASCLYAKDWEAEAGGSLQAEGQPGLQSKFQVDLCYTVKPHVNPLPSKIKATEACSYELKVGGGSS